MELKGKQRFAILGPGKVGTAVGHLLKRAGHDIVAVADLFLEEAQRAGAYTEASLRRIWSVRRARQTVS